MKKLVLALSAVAAFTGSALAADLPARTYTKAPMMAPVYNWTGFYIFGGAGGGLWDADSNVQSTGVVDRGDRRGGLGVGAGPEVSRNGRSSESRQRGQSEQCLFHIQSLSAEASNLIALTMREHPIPKTQCGDYTQFSPKSCCGGSTPSYKRTMEKYPNNGQFSAPTGLNGRK